MHTFFFLSLAHVSKCLKKTALPLHFYNDHFLPGKANVSIGKRDRHSANHQPEADYFSILTGGGASCRLWETPHSLMVAPKGGGWEGAGAAEVPTLTISFSEAQLRNNRNLPALILSLKNIKVEKSPEGAANI